MIDFSLTDSHKSLIRGEHGGRRCWKKRLYENGYMRMNGVHELLIPMQTLPELERNSFLMPMRSYQVIPTVLINLAIVVCSLQFHPSRQSYRPCQCLNKGKGHKIEFYFVFQTTTTTATTSWTVSMERVTLDHH